MALRIKYRVNKKVYTNESEFLKIEILENINVILHPTTKIELLSAVVIKPYLSTSSVANLIGNSCGLAYVRICTVFVPLAVVAVNS